jgi:hypothetical protein
MIPAILAAPLVQGVVGGVVGSVMNCFSPSAPPASPGSPAGPATSFSPYLNSASNAVAPQFSPATFSSGTIRASQWNQMGSVDMNSWMKSLQGSHVDATDTTGRTFSGTVSNVHQLGNTLALNIGGHLVSLSQLKQITWSPSIA